MPVSLSLNNLALTASFLDAEEADWLHANAEIGTGGSCVGRGGGWVAVVAVVLSGAGLVGAGCVLYFLLPIYGKLLQSDLFSDADVFKLALRG